MDFAHVPVLLNETVEALAIKPDGTYVDCTAGGGGHSHEIAKRLTSGRLICIDRDPEAIAAAKERLAEFKDRTVFVNGNYSDIKNILSGLGITSVNGVTADLGVSSHQIDTPERGFSYMTDGPLDMRMEKNGVTAADIINNYSYERLKNIFYEYGEERYSPKIAAEIVKRRETAPINTTKELADITEAVCPQNEKGGHPAKRVFQALRIEVNGEISGIAPMIRGAVEMLSEGGRIAVITFHSLEDRAVKHEFASLFTGCICPPEFPVCVCGRKPALRPVSKKPITPGSGELRANTRAHSAKLRVAERTENRYVS